MRLGEFLNTCDSGLRFCLHDGEEYLCETSTRSKLLKQFENRDIEKWEYNNILRKFNIYLKKE